MKGLSFILIPTMAASALYLFRSDIPQNMFRREQPRAAVTVWNGEVIRGFGYQRKAANEKEWETHEGIDIKARPGEPVAAAADGIVASVGWDKDLKDIVIIRNSNKTMKYANCVGVAVRIGQYVKKGDIIAHVAENEKNETPHLHFEVAEDGVTINPVDWMKSNYHAKPVMAAKPSVIAGDLPPFLVPVRMLGFSLSPCLSLLM